ncbi:MAG TPA: hypothetical protein VFW98_09470 [Gemmatimonadaceae bacterium]|nr:hypothetical protein [Gemmatimonadaceae bacterium]
MTVPFVANLRSRRTVVRLGTPDAPAISVRVEVPELWDVVRIDTPATEPVLAVKVAALAELYPGADQRHFVTKLRGFEVLDEHQSLADAGAVDGSIFLVTHRRRRPVR